MIRLILCAGLLGVLLLLSETARGQEVRAATAGDRIAIGNDQVTRTLAFDGQVWRTVCFSRADGTDGLAVDSDEFHLLYFDNRALTIDQCRVVGKPVIDEADGVTTLVIRYAPRREHNAVANEFPAEIVLRYTVQEGQSFLRKQIELIVDEANQKALDRLEVERFSTQAVATRGGRGQPVFLDQTWFTAIEHPAARARHTDGNTPKDFEEPWGRFGAYPYLHPVQGRDIDTNARPGLVRLLHFPAYPKPNGDGQLHLLSKPAVTGTSQPGDPLELGFLDYFDTVRRQPRSLSHYNNWYDPKGKDLRIANFVDHVLHTYNQHFSRYGVEVESMVPDNFNWHINSSFWAPNPRYFQDGDASMRRLNEALKESGSCLGLWLTLSGNNGMSMKWAQENGFERAKGGYFALAHDKNKAAMKQRLRELLVDVGINYFKHDFNALRSESENGHPPTACHGHEAEMDAMFELLDWELECNPDVFINVTNGVWFSPWFLMHCHSIWMLAHDDGAGQCGPEPSNFSHHQSYRDEVIFEPWGNPRTRPLVPIAQLMTHGIICAPHARDRYNDLEEESLRGWAGGIMMYYMRGTLLKEWYITPEELSRPQWDALGRAARWSKENEEILTNSIYWGGDPRKSEPYGYVAWKGEKGIVSLRNALPTPQTVTIPFDASVWFRAETGVSYRADVVFPWHGQWPEAFESGRPMTVTIPPFTIMVMHLEPGAVSAPAPAAVEPMPVNATVDKEGDVLKLLTLDVPDDHTTCELMVTLYGPDYPDVSINHEQIRQSRRSWSTNWKGPTDSWRTHCYDLTSFRGETIRVAVKAAGSADWSYGCDILLLQDRPVQEGPGSTDVRLPLPVSQGRRPAVLELARSVLVPPAIDVAVTAEDLTAERRAAHLTFLAADLQLHVATARLDLNGTAIATLTDTDIGPRTRNNGPWQEVRVTIPRDDLKLIRRENELRIVRNNGADMSKFKGFRLAVELNDGKQLLTRTGRTVYSSDRNWAYSEGTVFPSGDDSGPIPVNFQMK